jgi:RNA 3'-terminal phosphate cyclase (ATP)
MLKLDGGQGEGGGQILRTALSLSLVTQTPFQIVNIRAGRKKPGLLRQHLTAIRAAAAVGNATVAGDSLGSTEITFKPRRITPGDYQFAIGTAGSTSLVLQTVLPPLLTAAGPSTVIVEGGTHNPLAPSTDFLALAWAPLLSRMGPSVTIELESYGFQPAGGGRVRARVVPAGLLTPLEIRSRGPIQEKRARIVLSSLPAHIGDRENRLLREKLGLAEDACETLSVENPAGPGNVVTVELRSAEITELFSAVGERGRKAESVADQVVADVRRYIAAGVPVGSHLADQLLLPQAMSGGGSFLTVSPSNHLRTNIDVITSFLSLEPELEQLGRDAWRFAWHRK